MHECEGVRAYVRVNGSDVGRQRWAGPSPFQSPRKRGWGWGTNPYRAQVIHGDVRREEALDLPAMEVDGHHAVDLNGTMSGRVYQELK